MLVIIVSVLGFTLAKTFSSQTRSELNAAADEIVQILRKAQTFTISGKGDSVYGVHFEVDRYVYFEGATYNPLSSDNGVFLLPDILTLDQISLNGGGAEVIFSRPYGDTTNYGSLRIYLNDSQSRILTISSVGQITVT